MIFPEFQADDKWSKEKDMLKTADKSRGKSSREGFVRTWALMSSEPIAKAGSRLYRTFLSFSGEKDPNSSQE